jgi:hypothetical protein
MDEFDHSKYIYMQQDANLKKNQIVFFGYDTVCGHQCFRETFCLQLLLP